MELASNIPRAFYRVQRRRLDAEFFRRQFGEAPCDLADRSGAWPPQTDRERRPGPQEPNIDAVSPRWTFLGRGQWRKWSEFQSQVVPLPAGASAIKRRSFLSDRT